MRHSRNVVLASLQVPIMEQALGVDGANQQILVITKQKRDPLLMSVEFGTQTAV
jgi:hypothetical protein